MRWLNAGLWLLAGVMVVVGVAMCAGMAWLAWNTIGALPDAFGVGRGWWGLYAVGGSGTVTYLLARLAPVALGRARIEAAAYPDRTSKLLAWLTTMYGPLWAAGFFATPAFLLWPPVLGGFLRWENRRRATLLDAQLQADEDQVREIRSAMDGGGGTKRT